MPSYIHLVPKYITADGSSIRRSVLKATYPEMWLHITFCYLLLLISGDSTGLSAEGVAGRVLIILIEVTALVLWILFIPACAYLSGPLLSGNQLFHQYGGTYNLYTVVLFYVVNYMWQSRVENKHYYIAYFNRIAAFKAL